MKFAIIIPSRNRPKDFAKSINLMIDASANPENLFFYVIVDSDDPERQAYEKMLANANNAHLCIATPNQKLIYINNMASQAYRDGYDAFITHADDISFTKPKCNNWDIVLKEKIEQIPDRICLCWFCDGVKNERLATHPIITRQWFAILGYYFPEIFQHSYADTWIDDIARKINRAVYIPEIKFDLHHFATGRPMDETYARSQRIKPFDEFNYHLYAQLRERYVQLILKHIDAFKQKNAQ